MTETKQNLHQIILDRMYQIGEVSPASFVDVMNREPGLLERYLRSCGIHVRRAKIGKRENDRLKMELELEDDSAGQNFEIRFLRFDE